jgi:hypothetical protein
MQKQNEQNIFFLAELKQVELLQAFLAANPEVAEEGFLIIPLDVEIEYLLEERGIPFRSGRHYRTPDADIILLGEEWTTRTLDSKRWSFFSYRDVSLVRLYMPTLHGYINVLLYYADIVSNVILQHPSLRRLVAFPSFSGVPVSGNCVAQQQIRILVDVVDCIGKGNGKEVQVPKQITTTNTHRYRESFVFKRRLFGWGIALLNMCIALVRRPRRVKILASDYWKNLTPALQHLDSAEVILLDRKEAFNAGLRNIWKFRMRFLHLNSFSFPGSSERASAKALFAKEWAALEQNADPAEFLFRGVTFQSLVFSVLDTIVADAQMETLIQIDEAHIMLERLKPDVVWLRATMSAQAHFSILAQVARAQHIPSLEMQHGLEYLGPGSMTKHHLAGYTGVYGPLIQKEMREAGDTNTTTVVVGSPRFDVYKSLTNQATTRHPSLEEGLSVLCIAPMVAPGLLMDSYDVEEYFSAIASAVRSIPPATIVIKLRAGDTRKPLFLQMIARLFEGVPYTIAQFEVLWELYPHADIVVSCYSTAVLEALQSLKPVIYLGLSVGEELMGKNHFTPYAQSGALRLAYRKEEVESVFAELASDPSARDSLSEKGHDFLKREYAFDGHAGERAAALVFH